MEGFCLVLSAPRCISVCRERPSPSNDSAFSVQAEGQLAGLERLWSPRRRRQESHELSGIQWETTEGAEHEIFQSRHGTGAWRRALPKPCERFAARLRVAFPVIRFFPAPAGPRQEMPVAAVRRLTAARRRTALARAPPFNR